MPLKTNGKFMPQITLGLSVHRPEMIPLVGDWMQRHDAIILEEPPESNFRQMLRGSLSIELDKICIAALIRRMGDITAWPEKFTVAVLRVYHQFIDAYLNILRQKEHKPLDWFPQALSIDTELADGMRHFFSDYQHITRIFFELNQKLDRLREVENDNQSKLFQDRIDEIFELCVE